MSIDLSLERIRVLAAQLPAYTRPTCHVAGTNGKGSVTCMLSSMLISSSLLVGRFNSPHLIDIHDCILINHDPVSKADYDDARGFVEQIDKSHNTRASSFELLTLTALLVFERKKVDISVIEVGMGGRLDATNIIPDNCNLVSALTSVDLDHQAFLGNTVDAIAKEKAGIARKNRPFIVGRQKHPEVSKVVEEAITAIGGLYFNAQESPKREQDIPLHGHMSLVPSILRDTLSQKVKVVICLDPDRTPERFRDPISSVLPLYGEHQLDNLGLACSMVAALVEDASCAKILSKEVLLRITPAAIAVGIASTKWPGRLSFHSINVPVATSPKPRVLTVLADGAHNPASSETLGNFIKSLLSMRALSGGLESSGISLTLILALSHSPPKRPYETLAPLLDPSVFDHPDLNVRLHIALVRFTPPEGMPWVKSVLPAELAKVVPQLNSRASCWTSIDNDPDGGLGKALQWAATRPDNNEEGLVVVAGSLYLVADLYRYLKRQQLDVLGV